MYLLDTNACIRILNKTSTPLVARLRAPNDLMIAATALAHDCTLVTHNTDEFSRVLGLRIEDWEGDLVG